MFLQIYSGGLSNSTCSLIVSSVKKTEIVFPSHLPLVQDSFHFPFLFPFNDYRLWCLFPLAIYLTNVLFYPTDIHYWMLWKLWSLQSYSWRTRHGLTIFGTSKQEGLILISLLHYHLRVQTLIKAFIYPFEEQLLTVTFLVTDSNRLLTQSSFFSFIRLLCNTQ